MARTASTAGQQPPPALTYDSDDSCADSDDESVTNVQLGLADGELEGDDETNPLVSRIGGKPAWLPTKNIPPASVASCKHCGDIMELLVQVFAPLEGSAYDRTLLAWGCARPSCQRKGDGSLRVVRHLQHNPRWAAKLAKKRLKAEAREERQRQIQQQEQKRREEQAALKQINPFSAYASSATGIGASLFGGGTAAANPFSQSDAGSHTSPSDVQETLASDEEQDEEDEDEERLAEELAMKSAISEAAPSHEDWSRTSPRYQPCLYLDTVPEASSSARAGERAQAAKLTAKEAASLKASGGGTAANATDEELKGLEKEGYERMLLDGMDEVLEKFIARVGAEGRQVVRYELGGQPLPFSAQGEVFNALWPKKAAVSPSHRKYDTSRVPPCEACGGPRTFELQLMPNLVNTLRAERIIGDTHVGSLPDTQSTLDEETRKRRQLEAALGKRLANPPSSDGISRSESTSSTTLDTKTGLVWSTAIIFVCEADCCIPRDQAEGETWREEWVGLQFED